MDINATYSIRSYWGPEHGYRDVPCVEVSATIHRKGRRYEAKMSFIPAQSSSGLVGYQQGLWPRPRGHALRAHLRDRLRELAEHWRSTDEYAAKVVEWQRANLQRAVRVFKGDVEVTTVTLKVKRQKLAEARRKLKAFERKNP